MGANPVRVMASGAIDVNHRDEVYNGKVKITAAGEIIQLVSIGAVCTSVNTLFVKELLLQGH